MLVFMLSLSRSLATGNQGELMLLTSNYQIYHMPCGDLCATTCLEQSDDNVEVKVRLQ